MGATATRTAAPRGAQAAWESTLHHDGKPLVRAAVDFNPVMLLQRNPKDTPVLGKSLPVILLPKAAH